MLYGNLLYKMGHYFLDKQYINHGGEWNPDEPPEHGHRYERGAGEPERAD